MKQYTAYRVFLTHMVSAFIPTVLHDYIIFKQRLMATIPMVVNLPDYSLVF